MVASGRPYLVRRPSGALAHLQQYAPQLPRISRSRPLIQLSCQRPRREASDDQSCRRRRGWRAASTTGAVCRCLLGCSPFSSFCGSGHSFSTLPPVHTDSGGTRRALISTFSGLPTVAHILLFPVFMHLSGSFSSTFSPATGQLVEVGPQAQKRRQGERC
ncbi:hypothetical protein OH77DRAFT_247154 [Trametes cingulata]|nr:hypothetical protein OH77DRAFT_247154 [Trametes cingulata]